MTLPEYLLLNQYILPAIIDHQRPLAKSKQTGDTETAKIKGAVF